MNGVIVVQGQVPGKNVQGVQGFDNVVQVVPLGQVLGLDLDVDLGCLVPHSSFQMRNHLLLSL